MVTSLAKKKKRKSIHTPFLFAFTLRTTSLSLSLSLSIYIYIYIYIYIFNFIFFSLLLPSTIFSSFLLLFIYFILIQLSFSFLKRGQDYHVYCGISFLNRLSFHSLIFFIFCCFYLFDFFKKKNYQYE